MMLANPERTVVVITLLVCALLPVTTAEADDWPQFGRDGTRNAVSPERHAPTTWQIGKTDEAKPLERVAGTARNIKWSARLGSMTYGDPVVADGLVWIGTNNSIGPDKPDASVLACFRESDGKPLYRYVSPRLPQGRWNDWEYSSMACSPLIEHNRIWFVTNRAEVVCLDIAPLKTNEGEPKLLWNVDLIGQFGVFPRGSRMTLMHLCSIAGYKEFIYVITGNGTEGTDQQVANPDAPSLICFRKDTGAVVWQDNSPGHNILIGQWSSPTIIEIDGQAQCVAPQGDGWLRSFDPLTGKLIWEFDMNHKESKWANLGRTTRNDIIAAPVFAENRIYVATGQYVEYGEGTGRLVCIDPTRQGDVSSELAVDAAGQILPRRRVQAVDPAQGEKAIPNPNSAQVWEYTQVGDSKRFEDAMHRTVSNVAVHNGLVIAADFSGLVHCLDAKSGKRFWAHDSLTCIYGSPLIVDDRVYLVDEEGNVSIYGLSAEPAKALRMLNGEYHPLRRYVTDSPIYCSPIFANGVLYVATRGELFAIDADLDEPNVQLAGGNWPQWRGLIAPPA